MTVDPYWRKCWLLSALFGLLGGVVAWLTYVEEDEPKEPQP